jgi:hypothetical protein
LVKVILLFVILFGAHQLAAQKTYSENQLWIGSSCKLDFKKGWGVAVQYRVRQTKDVTKYYGSYLFVTLGYKINKHFNVFTDYRNASIVDVGHYHRYAVGVEAQTKWRKFEFSFRPMVQRQNQYFLGDDENNIGSSAYLRPRVKVRYAITKRLDVYAYAEPFVDIQNNTRVDWWQNAFGVKYEYIKNQKVNFFYIWQPDYTKKHLHTYNIYGVDLDFTIKVGKKKKKKNNGQDMLETPDYFASRKPDK